MSDEIDMKRVKTNKFYLSVFTVILVVGYILIALIEVLVGIRAPASGVIMIGLAAYYTSKQFSKYEGRHPRTLERKMLINRSFLISVVINALIVAALLVLVSLSGDLKVFLKAFPDVSGSVFVVAFIFVMLICAALSYVAVRLGYRKDKSYTPEKSEFEIISEQAEPNQTYGQTNHNAPTKTMSATLAQSSWEPPSHNDLYDVKAERAPWGRWLVGALALGLILFGAVWLATKVIVPSEVPNAPIDAAKSEQPEKPAVKKSDDDLAWVKALEKDTLEGYREYLALFPEGLHKEDAQKEIDAYDNKAWETAETRQTIAGYEDYLEAWPEGLHASKARERIAEMKAKAEAIAKDAAERAAQDSADWDSAAQENTIDSYGRYLIKQPRGKWVGEAQKRIDQIKADQAADAASQADRQAWEAAKAANRADGYQLYLNSYPQGAYVPQAMAAIEQLKPSPGRTFKDCDACPVMVSVASGNANLGPGENEPDARPHEKPQRPVTFTDMFAIGVTEVTFSQWEACVAGGGCTKTPSNNGWGGGNRPVINVSWGDAQKYAAWLSSETGLSYALPSEAQWEYAARAGDTGAFTGGSAAALCAFANGASQESGLKWANTACTDPAADRTLPVGMLGANKFGVKDMIGNVAEWTLDCNTLNLRDAPTNGGADQRGSCNQRVVRGGSWFSGPSDLRFSARLMQRRGDSNDFTGFRVVRKIEN